LDRARTDGRQVDAQVLAALRRLDEHAPPAMHAQPALLAHVGDALYGAVGALRPFDGDGAAVKHDAGLADIEGRTPIKNSEPRHRADDRDPSYGSPPERAEQPADLAELDPFMWKALERRRGEAAKPEDEYVAPVAARAFGDAKRKIAAKAEEPDRLAPGRSFM